MSNTLARCVSPAVVLVIAFPMYLTCKNGSSCLALDAQYPAFEVVPGVQRLNNRRKDRVVCDLRAGRKQRHYSWLLNVALIAERVHISIQ